jgi:hypothetical protein
MGLVTLALSASTAPLVLPPKNAETCFLGNWVAGRDWRRALDVVETGDHLRIKTH